MISASTGSKRSRSSPGSAPMACATIIAAPADAASPERRRRAGSPVTAVRISVHSAALAPPPPRTSPTGAVFPAPVSTRVVACRSCRSSSCRRRRRRLETALDVPRHRLDHGAGHVADGVVERQPDHRSPGRVAPPRRPCSAEPGQHDHTTRSRRARPGALRRGPRRRARPGGPASRRGTRPPKVPLRAAILPSAPRVTIIASGVACRETGNGQRHVGGRAPRHHGPGRRSAGAEHFAGAVPGADHHGNAGRQSELARRAAEQAADHRARRSATRGSRSATVVDEARARADRGCRRRLLSPRSNSPVADANV